MFKSGWTLKAAELFQFIFIQSRLWNTELQFINVYICLCISYKTATKLKCNIIYILLVSVTHNKVTEPEHTDLQWCLLCYSKQSYWTWTHRITMVSLVLLKIKLLNLNTKIYGGVSGQVKYFGLREDTTYVASLEKVTHQ